MGPASEASSRPEGLVGAVVVGMGPDVAGIGPVEERLLWVALAGQPVVSWSLRALASVPRIGELVLLVAAGRVGEAARLEAELGRHVLAVSADGDDPLLACLEVLSPQCTLVMIHYGNRPLISASSIDRGITVAEGHPGSGVVAAEPVHETIKQTSGNVVVATPPRSELVLLHSPQIYPRAELIRVYSAYQNGAASPGKDAVPDRVWRAAGLPLVPFSFSGEGDREGLIIAGREDLLLAEDSLDKRG